MPLILDGTLGISGVAGSAGTPSYQGTGTTTGVFYPTTTSLGLATDGTERMRIDASGNVGIGTNSANGKTEIVSTSSGTNTNALFLTNASSNASTSTSLVFGVSTAPTIRNATIRGINLGGNAIDLTFLTSNGDAPEERMRISASGNVGIGATSISRKLQISQSNATTYASDFDAVPNQLYIVNTNTTTNAYTGLQMDVGSNSQCAISAIRTGDGEVAMAFGTRVAGVRAERGRFNAAGYFKASNDASAYVAATGSYHEFVQTANSNGIYFKASNASYTGIINYIIADRNTTNSSFYPLAYYNSGASAFRLLVADSGNITNTNGSYGTISDIKNKENIVDATPKLDKINQLQVRNFNFKNDNLKQIGFIAQEFEQIFPSMVEEHHDKDEEGNDLGTTTKSIKTSVLVPILVKAIQEQQAMIEELKTRIETLEAK
jgi:hypothetical protein